MKIEIDLTKEEYSLLEYTICLCMIDKKVHSIINPDDDQNIYNMIDSLHNKILSA